MDKNTIKNRRWRTVVKNTIKKFNSKLVTLPQLQSVLSRAPNTVLKQRKKSRLLSRAHRSANVR